MAVDDDVFYCQQVGGIHGETTQTHRQQQAGVLGVAGHFAADGDGFAHAAGGADDVEQQVEHGRMGGLVKVADGIVGAVDREGVLD